MLAGWEHQGGSKPGCTPDVLQMRILTCFCPLRKLHALNSDLLGYKRVVVGTT